MKKDEIKKEAKESKATSKSKKFTEKPRILHWVKKDENGNIVLAVHLAYRTPEELNKPLVDKSRLNLAEYNLRSAGFVPATTEKEKDVKKTT